MTRHRATPYLFFQGARCDVCGERYSMYARRFIEFVLALSFVVITSSEGVSQEATPTPAPTTTGGTAVALPQVTPPMGLPCFVSAVAPDVRVKSVKRNGRDRTKVELWLPAHDNRAALLVLARGKIIDAAPLAPSTAEPGNSDVVALVTVPVPGTYDLIVRTVVYASMGAGCARFFETRVLNIWFTAQR